MFPSVASASEVAALYRFGVDRIASGPIRRAVRKILEHIVEPPFWVSPASSTGKYHPSWQNNSSGLVRHTVEMCVIAPRLVSAFPELDKPSKEYHLDMVLAAIVLHDAFKNGRPWGRYSHKSHGHIAADVWRQVSGVEDVSSAQAMAVEDAIRYHDGRWCSGGLPTRVLPAHQHIVHMVDMISSSNELEMLFSARPYPPDTRETTRAALSTATSVLG